MNWFGHVSPLVAGFRELFIIIIIIEGGGRREG